MSVKKAMKRAWKAKVQILVWLLVISLIVPMLPPPKASAAAELPMQITDVTATTKFQDVKDTDWFHDAVVQMQAKGIFSGTTADTFSPKGTMTRAMYITALGRMAGVDTGAYLTSSFADVPVGSWYAPYIEWAVQKGITDGTGASKYSPNTTVSREQMATMTLRYFESEQIPYQSGTPLTTQPGDLANVSSWAVEAVVQLWKAGVFTGDEKGNFNPRNQATRAEAAVLFMRNSAIVEAWKGSNTSTPEPTPAPTPTPIPTVTPNPTPSAGGNNGGGTPGGNNGGGTPTPGVTYTLTFESNGGSAVDPQKVRKGEVIANLPAPTKEGYIFQGWFTDTDFSLIFENDSELTADTKLYAKYADSVENAVQSTPSYSVLDVAPNFSLKVQDTSGTLTKAEVEAGMKFEDTANPNFAGIVVTSDAGAFTVTSAAEDGKFVEGNTYQLTLTDNRLNFQGQDATTSIYVFSVAKQEAVEIPLNPNMIYLSFGEVKNMILNGQSVNAPAISVMSTTVDGSENALAEANASSGTFVYNGSTAIQIGDTVAIYEGIRPDLRTAETTGSDNGDIAYVQITAIDDKSYTYDRAESKDVLLKPDVLPVSVDADEDDDANNNSITVEHTVMNYSDSRYAEFGLDELTTVDVGDFIGFYEGNFAEESSRIVSYGRITSITPDAEMDIITYDDATIEDIENVFNVYQTQAIDGDDLLSEEQIEQIEEQMEQQALDSGFVDQAAEYLTDAAMDTQEFKTQTFLASGKSSRVSVENLTVVASLGTRLKNIDGRNSGVSASLQIGADIVVNVSEDSDLVIHMTGTFVQEISLDLNVNGDMQGHWLKKWGIPYWYSIDDYVVTANLDAYSYTGLNIKAEIALVEKDKLEAALNDWLGEKKAGRLGKVQDIATQIQASIDGVQDTAVDTESLKEQYKEMMEKDTEWVPLIKKTLFEKSMRVAMGLVEVKFEAEFVVSAQVNLTMGVDFYYKMAKRYSVTVRVLSFSGSTNTVSLPGDGDYQFTFYVMGTLGLRAGIHMEVKAGLGSVDLNSIGLSVEPGAYINLWGYFYYQLKNISGIKSTKSLGALYVEIGIYLDAALGAQLGDGALSDELELLSEEWPLYTIGEAKNVTDFAYPQDKNLGMALAGVAASLDVPKSLLTMSVFDLTDGSTESQAYAANRFDIQVDNANFKYNAATGKVEVVNTSLPVSKGNLTITWKGAPLSFASSPIKRTIPLSWRVTAGEYIMQLDPRNGGVTQVLPIVYNAAVKIKDPVYPGYTFQGWYTSPTGGTKVTIPSRMPKEDYELYARWTVNTNTPYTVEHYLIDANTRKSISTKPDYTELLTGTTDTEIHIDSDRFKAQGYANGVSNGRIIKGDESTVVRIDYYPAIHTIGFNLGYSGAPRTTISEPAGRTITGRIPVPTRTGYTFAGWSPEMPTTMPASSTEYTALWTAKEDTPYQVVYLKQDMGSNSYTVADTETYRGATGSEANLDNVEPRSYPGFEFDENITGTVLKSPIASNGKTVLKLYYKRDAHTLTIDYNGSGQTTKVVEVPFGATLPLGTPVWNGHAFAGWSPTPPTTMPGEDVTVTAQWTTNAYTISFNANGASEEVGSQSIEYGSLVNRPIEPTKEGYAFGGWYSDSSLQNAYDFETSVTGDLMLHAKWLLRYNVSFDSMGGSPIDAQVVNEGDKVIAPTAPTKDGDVFSGWYSDSELTSAYSFTTAVVTSDIILYAKWVPYVPTTYAVSFDSMGGSAVDAQTVTEGAVATIPTTPTLDRHTFEGWYSDSEFMNAYGFTEGVMADLTLYAKWSLNRYTVTFNSNGGPSVSNQSVDDGNTVSEPEAPTRAGYVFGGWYTNGTLIHAYDFSTQVTANLTLYAKWTALYTVTFQSNDGSPVDPQVVEYDGRAVSPTDPIREEYIFSGWYIDEGLIQAYDFATSVTADLTLYAKWVSDKRTVSFESGEGSAVDSQLVSPRGKATEPTAPTWEGYAFEGWYSDSELTTAYDFDAEVTSDITLYAKWTFTPWYYLRGSFDGSSTWKILADSQGTTYVYYNNGSNYYLDKYQEGVWSNILQSAYAFTNFAFDKDDTLYMASSNGSSAFVQKYNGETWEDVGRDGSLQGQKPNLAFDGNNELYVVYNQNGNQMAVAKYDGTQWIPVTGGSSLGGEAANPTIKFDGNNIPYVMNDTNTVIDRGGPAYNGRGLTIKVSKYENGAWVSLGNLGLVEIKPILERAQFEVDSEGTPYVLHSSPSGWSLMKYNGTEWVRVGSDLSTAGYLRLSLSLDKYDVPYVGYADNNEKGTVVKYEGAWVKVGEESYISASQLTISFAVGKDGNLYMSFLKKDGDQKMTVMKHKIQ